MNADQPPRIRPQPPRIHPVTRWHRLVGVASTAIVLVTIATGLVLNHGDALDLSRRRAQNAAVRYLYAPSGTPLSASYRVGENWITQIGSSVFLDRGEIFRHDGAFVGATRAGAAILLAFEDGVVEVDGDSNVVQRYGALDGLQPPLRRIGSDGNDAWVDGAGGLVRFDAATATFSPSRTPAPSWQVPGPLPDAIAAELASNFGVPEVTYEKVLLDLHSGRMFGAAGVFIVDAAAVCLLILALTGVYLWFKFKRNNFPLRQKDFPVNPP